MIGKIAEPSCTPLAYGSQYTTCEAGIGQKRAVKGMMQGAAFCLRYLALKKGMFR
jgi:hypothetical protein